MGLPVCTLNGWMFMKVKALSLNIIIIIISVLSKGRSFTAKTQAPRLQLCPKAGLPPQTQEPRLQFYQGLNRCGSVPLLSAPHSLFSIWTDLKRYERIPGTPTWKGGEWIWLTGPSGLNRNSPQGLNISSIRVLTRSEIRKLQSHFAPLTKYRPIKMCHFVVSEINFYRHFFVYDAWIMRNLLRLKEKHLLLHSQMKKLP